jgi:GNAT superfamily N-acetyltransferase
MIRPATPNDVPAIVAMGIDQMAEIYPAMGRNETRLAETLTRLMASDDGLALVADDGETLTGMIGVVLFPHHLTGDLTAGEVFWFVRQSARGTVGMRLLKAAEAWAIEKGAKCLQMSAPPGSSAEAIYARLGYQAIETTHRKEIAC